MLLKGPKLTTTLLFLIFCLIKCETSASYKTEVEITPATPVESSTTKKSGFFGGIKKWFGGSSQTTESPLPKTTTVKSGVPLPVENAKVPASSSSNQKPPPLVISNAPLVPLGPRPDTPLTSPSGAAQPQWPHAGTNKETATSTTTKSPHTFGGKQQIPSQWPQPHPVGGILSTTPTLKPLNHQASSNVQNHLQRPGGIGRPNLPPGVTPYQPPKSQPSGLDLSYGVGVHSVGRPQQNDKHGSGIDFMNIPSSTSRTTSTTTSKHPQLDFDLRSGHDSKAPSSPSPSKENYPSLPTPRRPPAKEDFPPLPTPKSPSSATSPSPSAWNKPLPTRAGASSSSTAHSQLPSRPQAGSNTNGGVSFVPHSGTTTTVRPGFEKEGNSLATDDEIRSLTENLYTKEVNSQLSLITVKPQGKTRSIDSTDEAPQPLLEVDAKAFDVPTIAKMRLLFNNYEEDTLVNEHVSPIERKEENDFVDAVMATNVMKQAMLFLQNKGIVTADPKTHRDLVKELWFTQYSRGGGKIGSSGFEHVFVNEVKNGTIIGLHNWVYFHDEEKLGHLDYKGYLHQLDLGTKGKVLKVRFTHNGLNKPVNTLFIGTSPELELALYTVCFKLRPDRTCPVCLANNRFGIVTYSWRYRGKSLIGSAYPEI